MRRPDDELINQLRERFGGLLLSFHGERRMAGAHIDARDQVLLANHANEMRMGPLM